MCKKMIILLSLIMMLALAGSASAASLTWNGDGDGSSWDDLDNWDGDAVPTAVDTAIMDSGASVTIDNSMTAVAYAALVGDTSASPTLSVTGGSFDVGTDLTIGQGGFATGTLTVSGGTVDAGGEIKVANFGTGTLTVSGGDIDATGIIRIGHGAPSDGTVTVNSGKLSTDDSLIVGNAGTGSLDVNDGSVDIGDVFYIGKESGSDGDVTLDGGTITAGGFKMSTSSTQSSMDITNGILYIGSNASEVVQDAIDDGCITTSVTNATVAYDYYEANHETKVYSLQPGVTITFDNGGTGSLWSVLDNWSIDKLPTTNDPVQITGSYSATIDSTMEGSRGADAKSVWVGVNSGDDATLTISGGRVSTSPEDLDAGIYAGSEGTINISGGEVISDRNIIMAWAGDATLNVSGGSVYADSTFFIAALENSSATVNVTGGEIFIGGVVHVAWGGDATLNVSDGVLETVDDLSIAGHSLGTGDVSLDGGVIIADDLLMYANRSSMDITDGVLILNGDDTTTVNGYISNANITLTANGGSGTLAVTYDSNTDKTYVYDNGTGTTQTWDGSSSNDWATAANWNNNRLPMALDSAKINSSTGAVTIDGDVEVDDLHGPGYGSSTSGTLTINDGNIQVHDELWLGRFGNPTVNIYYPAEITCDDEFKLATGSGTTGTLNLHGGIITTTNSSRALMCGYQGTATVNMYSGKISAAGNLAIPAHALGTTTVNLHGGVIDCNTISILSGSKIDIADSGQLIINGDVRTTINTYLSDNRITIGGSTTDSLARVDYDDLHSGKTTVMVNHTDVVGSNHVAPVYYFGTDDCLNEGAQALLDMGAEVIKIFIDSNVADLYPWNSNWPTMNSLVDRFEASYVEDLFDKDFSTFVLNITTAEWQDGMSIAEQEKVEQDFYDLTEHLLTTYNDTDKTFILQHWEGDWLLNGNTDKSTVPTQTSIDGMIDWLNARQAGVNAAREDYGFDGVRVFHATEVCLVIKSMDEGKASVTKSVIPYTNVDLVSYSCYEAVFSPYLSSSQKLEDTLDYIASMTNDSPYFGDKNVYIGEFGMPENEFSQSNIESVMTNTLEGASKWGCRYILYWNLYCNEVAYGDPRPSPPITSNSDARGYWLIKPDGTDGYQKSFFDNALP